MYKVWAGTPDYLFMERRKKGPRKYFVPTKVSFYKETTKKGKTKK